MPRCLTSHHTWIKVLVGHNCKSHSTKHWMQVLDISCDTDLQVVLDITQSLAPGMYLFCSQGVIEMHHHGGSPSNDVVSHDIMHATLMQSEFCRYYGWEEPWAKGECGDKENGWKSCAKNNRCCWITEEKGKWRWWLFWKSCFNNALDNSTSLFCFHKLFGCFVVHSNMCCHSAVHIALYSIVLILCHSDLEIRLKIYTIEQEAALFVA